jgi:hypothetical protein
MAVVAIIFGWLAAVGALYLLVQSRAVQRRGRERIFETAQAPAATGARRQGSF